MAFDVSVNRSIYAYGYGSQVYFFRYDGIMSPVPLANMSLSPDSRNNLTISDIRFASSFSATLFVTVRQSDAVYRCIFLETTCTLWVTAEMMPPETGRSFQVLSLCLFVFALLAFE